MKKQMAVLACSMLTFCMSASAQMSGNGDSQMKTDDTHKSGHMHHAGGMHHGGGMGTMSAVGCVAEKDGKYMLTNKRHPDGIGLDSSEDLKPHVGHKIKATGTMEKGAGMSGDMKSGEKSNENMGMMSMKMTSMKMISTECTTGGMTKK